MTKLLIFYKIGGPGKGKGHYHAGGLANNGIHTVDSLKEIGVDAELVAVAGLADVIKKLAESPVSHVVLEAVWIRTNELRTLAQTYPETVFVVRAHSKIGFLQVEPESVERMREIIRLGLPNVFFASNNLDFYETLYDVYGHLLYLPNLYKLTPRPITQVFPGGRRLRVGSFGATRLLKMHPSAALAALHAANRLGVGLELYINSDSTPGGDSVRKTLRNMLAGMPDTELIELPWQPSDEFIRTISKMDLVFQLSATETFCHVAADAVSVGVPVVGGNAIVWLPDTVDPDDVRGASRLADEMLRHPQLAHHQWESLELYVIEALEVWVRFLETRVGHHHHRR